MKKNMFLSIIIICTLLTFNALQSAQTPSKRVILHKPLVQSKKQSQFMKIKPLEKGDKTDETIHERTQKLSKSKKIEEIDFK